MIKFLDLYNSTEAVRILKRNFMLTAESPMAFVHTRRKLQRKDHLLKRNHTLKVH
jgi:hypothetical protein